MKPLPKLPADITLESLGASSTEADLPEGEVSSHYSPGSTSGIEERALSLLGSGIDAEQVAAALGVTPSRISQLLSDESFAHKVADIRYQFLQQHNVRDERYDNLEDRFLDRLEKHESLFFKPNDILKALTTLNSAKRRGQSAPTSVTNNQNIVTLVLPKIIAAEFSIDMNNQVIKAGDQELLTMPSGNLLKQVEDAQEVTVLEHNPTPTGSVTEEAGDP